MDAFPRTEDVNGRHIVMHSNLRKKEGDSRE